MTHRFSPRPNRAGEIGWLEWGNEAFERARETNRPILLGISAVWCHWCHVMDETTYSDPNVIDLIKKYYVPVRVDNDRNPEINVRYNQGGWPTTAFLAPSGEILTGATYVPPDAFAQMLEGVANAWKAEQVEIERRIAERRGPLGVPTGAPEGELDADAIQAISDYIVDEYDEEHAGFGTEPKFPQPNVLNFLLLLYRYQRAQGGTAERLYEILARTALAMARSGMYDHVEGGFFRYSTTRDWSVPHFEKMAEEHAGLIRFYADLYRAGGNEQFAQTLRSALRWLRTTLRNPGSALFAGSQDADEAYFALPLDERQKREAPFVDRTVYTNWNAELASALVAASIALDDDTLLDDARQTVRALDGLMVEKSSGLALHFQSPGGTPQHGPLLADQVAMLDAFLAVHSATGEAEFLERARQLADATMASLRDPNGAFADGRNALPVGNMRFPHYPLDDNAKLGDALLRLGEMLHDKSYAKTAQEILLAMDGMWQRAGFFAAPYAAALLRALEEPLTIVIAGRPEASAALRDAALRLPNPLAVVSTVPPDPAVLQSRGYLESDEPHAYICAGTRCAAPAHDATTLQESYDALRQLPVR